MHKIIKPGKKELITKSIYEATCSKCGCRFEFDDEEITKRTKNFSKNFLSITIWVECPCCGNELEINNPKVVREEPIEEGNK